MYKTHLKRFIDFFAALAGIVIIIPVLAIVSLLLLFANKGTPFFVQPRPSKNNRIFKLVKFKTMNDRCDTSGKLLPDKDRLTKAGRLVRSTSLDELPQLLNVLKGDMSLIGPRPLLVKYLDRYTPEQARRHEVRPGITGWAQVNGRNAIGWEEKFKLDVWYVDNLSFTLDCKILWQTLINVIQRKGISQADEATMKEFKGSQ